MVYTEYSYFVKIKKPQQSNKLSPDGWKETIKNSASNDQMSLNEETYTWLKPQKYYAVMALCP